MVSTVSGKQYVLEYKQTLSDPVWTVLLTVSGAGTEQEFQDPTALEPARYYRVRVED